MNVLSFYRGMRQLRPAGAYTAALWRLKLNVGTASSRSAPPPMGGAPMAMAA